MNHFESCFLPYFLGKLGRSGLRKFIKSLQRRSLSMKQVKFRHPGHALEALLTCFSSLAEVDYVGMDSWIAQLLGRYRFGLNEIRSLDFHVKYPQFFQIFRFFLMKALYPRYLVFGVYCLSCKNCETPEVVQPKASYKSECSNREHFS